MNTRYVTDGGLETELVFHRGFDLPEFAAFPLLDTTEGTIAWRIHEARKKAKDLASGKKDEKKPDEKKP